jgi:ketosteroid isomerase-like protein
MRKSVLIAATLACWPVAVSAQQAMPADPAAATAPAAPAATPADDATKFVTGIIDKFNGGDAKAWVSAQADDTMIVDEFGPHTWSGAGSAQRWLDDYMKDSQANGVTGGRVDYGKPLQATSDGTTAYIVMPTTYRFVAKGAKMAEPSNMTFVMKHGADGWKITSWTYSATGEAVPEK